MLKNEGQVKNQGLPVDIYHWRATKAVFGKSRNKNPMITVDWEIVSPEEVEVDGKTLTTDKVKARTWHTLTPDAVNYYFDFMARAGVSIEEVDDTNPDLSHFDNLIIKAALKVEERVVKGRDGQPLRGDDGKPLSEGIQYGLGAVAGPSDLEVAGI